MSATAFCKHVAMLYCTHWLAIITPWTRGLGPINQPIFHPEEGKTKNRMGLKGGISTFPPLQGIRRRARPKTRNGWVKEAVFNLSPLTQRLAPTCNGEGLAGGGQCQGPFPHARDGSHTSVDIAIIDQVLIHLIGHDHHLNNACHWL